MKKIIMIFLLFTMSVVNVNAKVLDNSMLILTEEPTVTDFGNGEESCSDILGPTLTELVKYGITIVRIAGGVIALVNGMMQILPAVMSKDANALKKAIDKCVIMVIVLAAICLFPTILNILGKLFQFDMSCLA